MRSFWDLPTDEVAVETAQLSPKIITMIMPVELTPTHSPRKNAPYALRPCNSPRTDISNYFRGVYSQKCLLCYYETGCWV
jgi:hypothetical protein